MSTDIYHDNSVKELFANNQLTGFKELWALKTEWFEEPNYRRNGWSGVIKQPFIDENGKPAYIFVKRQENHNHKTLMHPFSGVPTFRREFNNINRLEKKNIPSLKAFYYGERKVEGKRQAVLVTQSLEGYQSFEQYCMDPNNTDKELWRKILQRAGIVVRRLHDARFRHNCLYPKHLFVKVENAHSNKENIDVRLIDLEKLTRRPFSSQVRRNDLSRIIRRFDPLTKADVLTLLDSYLSYGQDLNNSALKITLDGIIKAYLKG